MSVNSFTRVRLCVHVFRCVHAFVHVCVCLRSCAWVYAVHLRACACIWAQMQALAGSCVRMRAFASVRVWKRDRCSYACQSMYIWVRKPVRLFMGAQQCPAIDDQMKKSLITP